jgi:hypothetical protein
MAFVSNETFDFLDGSEFLFRIDEFHFASNIPKFIEFGLNLSLVEIFNVI